METSQQNQTREKAEEFKVDLDSLKVPIEKYPMAESKNMFENFLIIGYDDLYFQEKIVKQALETRNKMENLNVKEKKNIDKMQFSKFYCRNLPTILSSITSDFKGPILNGNQIIENVFPIPPEILLELEGKDLPSEKKNPFIIFSNIQNEVVNYGYGHIFYEKKIFKEMVMHVPKAFVIISQYPFFRIFNKLCSEILELFNKNQQQLQIPIEIQIYNIINFVPASIDTGLKMTLIPKEELNQIKFLKTQDDLFNSSLQKKYYAAQLNGYRVTEVNFCYLLNVISVELIIEIYMNLICGKIIGFFYKNSTELSIILHIFHQFLFPFAPNENVSCLSPIKFFCNDTVDQNIVGFLCNYDDLEKFDPFREVEEGQYRYLTEEDENNQLDPLYFRCDYILDLNKKIFKEPDKYSTGEDNSKETKQLNNYIKKILTKKKAETEFEQIFLALFFSLEENISKLTLSKKANNSVTKNMFLPLVNEETTHLNKIIIKSFYEFNLNLAYLYYQKISQYKWDCNKTKEEQINIPIKSKKDCQLNDDEYLFLSSFANSLFCNCLDNFVGGYSTREPKIYQAPKLIFENLLYFLNLKKSYKFDQKFSDFLDIYDEIFTNKIKNIGKEDPLNLEANKKDNNQNSSVQLAFYEEEEKKNKEIMNKNHKTFTFLEFYKYYIQSPDTASYFYNIANPEYVSGKIIKTSPNKVKYIFKYKKIDLDQNIIIKYIYKLKQMGVNIREKCFKNIIQYDQNEKDNVAKNEKIRTYENFISSAIEKYYIDNKYIDNIELINFSILGIVILTVSKHKLINFIEPINAIIKNLIFLTRKFTEIILSVSLRVFFKEQEKNANIYEKYFNIYKTAIEEKNIFPNDELIKIQKKISQFRKIFKTQKDISNLNNAKKEYKLEYNKKASQKVDFLGLYKESDETKTKINIKLKLGKKKFEFPTIYNIQKLYENICNLINDYYEDLDYNIILNKKEEFNRLIIYLLVYVTIIKEKEKEKEKLKEKKKDKKEKKLFKEEIKRDFPEDINLFLIDCLED